MSLTSLSLHPMITAAAEAGHGEPTIHPYVVGALALAALLALLGILLAFGGGREHS